MCGDQYSVLPLASIAIAIAIMELYYYFKHGHDYGVFLCLVSVTNSTVDLVKLATEFWTFVASG